MENLDPAFKATRRDSFDDCLASVPDLPALGPDTVLKPGCHNNLEGSGKALRGLWLLAC